MEDANNTCDKKIAHNTENIEYTGKYGKLEEFILENTENMENTLSKPLGVDCQYCDKNQNDCECKKPFGLYCSSDCDIDCDGEHDCQYCGKTQTDCIRSRYCDCVSEWVCEYCGKNQYDCVCCDCGERDCDECAKPLWVTVCCDEYVKPECLTPEWVCRCRGEYVEPECESESDYCPTCSDSE